MNLKDKVVRILVLGSENVGKTAIIFSLITEEFNEEVIPKADEITIPSDITPEHVPTQIIDFSFREQDALDATEEIERADAICLVFSLDNPESLEDIEGMWLPLIEKTREDANIASIPIILVGNKIDLFEEIPEHIENICIELMKDHPMIDAILNCSAKTMEQLSEIFYLAQKAVLHPTLPLIDTINKKLSDKCIKALSRIFKICDVDRDSILSDEEVSDFQKLCFKNPLHRQGLNEIRGVIAHYYPDGVNDKGINLEGFLCLQHLFILRSKQETTWTVLRKFGYDNNLDFSQDYILPETDISSDSVVELSNQAIHFLTDFFLAYDKDNDGYLNNDEFAQLFSICPELPFSEEEIFFVDKNENQWLSLGGFLSLFVQGAFYNHQWLLGLMSILGFELGQKASQMSAIHVFSKNILWNSKTMNRRSTYICKVIGLPNNAKELLNSLLKNNNETNQVDDSDLEIIKHFKILDRDIFVIFQQVDWSQTAYDISNDFYDVLWVLHDLSVQNSFFKLEELLRNSNSKSYKFITGTNYVKKVYSQNGLAIAKKYCTNHLLREYEILNDNTLLGILRDMPSMVLYKKILKDETFLTQYKIPIMVTIATTCVILVGIFSIGLR